MNNEDFVRGSEELPRERPPYPGLLQEIAFKEGKEAAEFDISNGSTTINKYSLDTHPTLYNAWEQGYKLEARQIKFQTSSFNAWRL